MLIEANLDLAGGITLPNRRKPLSPRQILQWWGTEYRRAMDPDYWIKQADQWIYDVWASCMYPEHRPQLFVNTSVRFPNERQWIHKFTNGQVWHMRREGLAAVNAHVSETPLPVLHDAYLTISFEGQVEEKRCFERELFNNDTVDRLHSGIELLLSTQAKFVRVEPMLPTVDPRDISGNWPGTPAGEVAVQDKKE